MCVVSMVGDHYNDRWKDHPWLQPNGLWPPAGTQPNPSQTQTTLADHFRAVSRLEFEALKKDVEEMKKLLERAVEYDKKNNEPDCHMDEKVALLKRIAELVGVDLTTIFNGDK